MSLRTTCTALVLVLGAFPLGAGAQQMEVGQWSRVCGADTAYRSLGWLRRAEGGEAVTLGRNVRFLADAISRDSADSALAALHAPILWFASTELDFPTMPFFTAWDGIDNNGGSSGTDFADTTEIAVKRDGRMSWDSLLNLYRAGGEDARLTNLHRSSVFYRVCDLSDEHTRELYRILRLDEQAWSRLQLDADFPPSSTPYQVIQYYMYYVRDAGLQGHPHDTEKVFVFAPKGDSTFRIIVGAGHTDRVPNNVLIQFAPRTGESILSDTVNVVVELGGHSSAPALRPFGSFEAGVDANWQAHDLWGTRDIQAAVGTGFFGNYQPGYGFIRDPEEASMVRLYPPRIRVQELREREVQQFKTVDDQAKRPTRNYRLVSLHTFRRLVNTIDDWYEGRPLGEIPYLVDDIQRELGHPGRLFSRLGADSQLTAVRSIKQEWDQPLEFIMREERVLKRGRHLDREDCGPWSEVTIPHRDGIPARRWREIADETGKVGARCFATPHKHRIWETDIYKNRPTDVFKPYLFRPTVLTIDDTGDFIDLFTASFTGYGGPWSLGLGFIVPAQRSHWLPVRLPGVLQIHGGVVAYKGKTSPTLGVLIDFKRNGWFSGYVNPTWTPQRAQVLCACSDPPHGHSDISMAAGVTLLPVIGPTKQGNLLYNLANKLRFRVGLRAGAGYWNDAAGRIGWEIQIEKGQ